MYIEATCDLAPDNVLSIDVNNLPEFVTVSVVADGKTVAEYTEKNFNKLNMPDVITDMPAEAGMNSADDLYLAGVHVDQYRDPAVLPDSYWKEALNRNINHIPSLDEIILLNEEQKNKLLLYSKLLALLNLILVKHTVSNFCCTSSKFVLIIFLAQIPINSFKCI